MGCTITLQGQAAALRPAMCFLGIHHAARRGLGHSRGWADGNVVAPPCGGAYTSGLSSPKFWEKRQA